MAQAPHYADRLPVIDGNLGATAHSVNFSRTIDRRDANTLADLTWMALAHLPDPRPWQVSKPSSLCAVTCAPADAAINQRQEGARPLDAITRINITREVLAQTRQGRQYTPMSITGISPVRRIGADHDLVYIRAALDPQHPDNQALAEEQAVIRDQLGRALGVGGAAIKLSQPYINLAHVPTQALPANLANTLGYIQRICRNTIALGQPGTHRTPVYHSRWANYLDKRTEQSTVGGNRLLHLAQQLGIMGAGKVLAGEPPYERR